MRSVKRIDVVTGLINKVWRENQDLRLWQLQEYVAQFIPEENRETDPFFWEEDVWIKTLENAIKKGEK